MNDTVPVVYILHGEDDYGIAGFIKTMQEKLGDPTTAEMNTTQLEGSYDLEALRGAAYTTPFLASRRVVIAEDVTRKFLSEVDKQKFCQLLDNLPASTALVLVEKRDLKDDHWLLKWARGTGGKTFIKSYSMPGGAEMTTWIRKYAVEQGGEITPQAVARLSDSMQEVPRMAASEVDKLLAYVNYARPIDMDDVEMVTAFVRGEGDFFKLIDAITAHNSRSAMDMLEKLLDEQDHILLFFSLVGHFRLLLQTREIYEGGGRDDTTAKTLGIHPYRAQKLMAQARALPLDDLEQIFLNLHRLDLMVKTGQIETALALETLVVELSA